MFESTLIIKRKKVKIEAMLQQLLLFMLESLGEKMKGKGEKINNV